MGILKTNGEDDRPLVHNTSSSITSSDSVQTISDGYVNEAIFDSQKLVTSKLKQSFNRQTFQMHYPLSPINNAIPLSTLKFASSQTSSNIITTLATVHTTEKSTNLNTCYNKSITNYNESNFCEVEYKKKFDSEPSTPTYGLNTQANIIPPILPLVNDALSLTEQNDLQGAPWLSLIHI